MKGTNLKDERKLCVGIFWELWWKCSKLLFIITRKSAKTNTGDFRYCNSNICNSKNNQICQRLKRNATYKRNSILYNNYLVKWNIKSKNSTFSTYIDIAIWSCCVNRNIPTRNKKSTWTTWNQQANQFLWNGKEYRNKDQRRYL